MNDDTDGRNKAITGVHGQCFVKDRQASCMCHGGLCCVGFICLAEHWLGTLPWLC